MLEAFLFENPAGASGSDPTTDPKGAYDYDYDIGTEQWIGGKNAGELWYRAPGQIPGTGGDPWRDEDPMSYLGFHPKADNADATPPASDGEEGVAARGKEEDVQDASKLPDGL